MIQRLDKSAAEGSQITRFIADNALRGYREQQLGGRGLVHESAPCVALLVAKGDAVGIGYPGDAVTIAVAEYEAEGFLVGCFCMAVPDGAKLISESDKVAVPVTVHMLTTLALELIETGGC